MELTGYYGLYNVRHDFIEYTRLIHGNMKLMTSMNITRVEECYKLEMTISEASMNWYIQRLRYIGLDR
jgi:hypothetical protein